MNDKPESICNLRRPIMHYLNVCSFKARCAHISFLELQHFSPSSSTKRTQVLGVGG